MATSKSRSRRRSTAQQGPSSPSQQDEADIVAEVGAKRDEELDEFVADEDKVRAIGAVDADSVRENRRLGEIVNKKRANMPGVPFNASDMLTKFDWIVKFWPPNTLNTRVRRLTGSPVQHTILTFPRSGAELYNALMEIHGQYDEAKYEVFVVDSNDHQFRGKGQITLPDTRPKQQGGHPMSAQYPPPHGAPPFYQPPPPGYPQQQPWQQQPQWPSQPQQHPLPPGYSPPQGAPPQQPPQQTETSQASPQQPAQQPPPPPQVLMPPPGPDPMQMMQQMFGMFTEMRNSLQQQANPAQPPPPPMPPPPAHADPQTMMQWMHNMFEMFQTMQQQQQAPSAPAYPPSAPTAQAAQSDPMAMMTGMVDLFGKMSQVFNAQQGRQEPERPRGPLFRGGPRRPPPYNAHEDGYPSPYSPPAPPQPEKSPGDAFRDALSVVRTAVEAAQEVSSLIPQQQQPQQPQIPFMPVGGRGEEDEDSPVKIIDTGSGRLVVNRKDGSLRGVETVWSNMDKLLNWVAEQREAVQQKAPQEEQRQLPPGYVEVTEGYEPPEGYVAVPVQPHEVPRHPVHQPLPTAQGGLAPPPAHMPPPIQATPPSKRQWEMPPVPREGEG